MVEQQQKKSPLAFAENNKKGMNHFFFPAGCQFFLPTLGHIEQK